MRKVLITILLLATWAVHAESNFKHTLPAGKKPWTHENFIAGDDKFTFIIIPDRTGSERPGIFEEAIRKANMFRPDFIVTVGDLIQGPTDRTKQSPEHLREQWRELAGFTAKSKAPFFYIIGNHDISRTRNGFPRANEDSSMVWKEFAGENTYYSFVYKNVLFLCLNIMEGRDSRVQQIGITDQQAQWAVDTLNKNANVDWTIILLHAPSGWIDPNYAKIQKVLDKRKYTSFAGDWHHYIKFKRYGRDHYVLGTAGGVSQMRGIDYGEFDHITYVTMSKNGPEVVNVKLDGILSDDVVTAQNIQRDYREILDTEPFVRNPKFPWKAVIDNYALRRTVGQDDSQVARNRVIISGKNGNGKKVLSKVIELDHPAVGGKTLQIVAALHAELPTNKNASFNVHARILDENGRIVKCDGFTLTRNFNWKFIDCTVKVPENGKRLQLVFAGVNFDSNSIGETQNIFVFERQQ